MSNLAVFDSPVYQDLALKGARCIRILKDTCLDLSCKIAREGEDENMKTRLISYSALAATVMAMLSLVLIPGVARNKPDDEKKWCVACSVDGKTTPRTA